MRDVRFAYWATNEDFTKHIGRLEDHLNPAGDRGSEVDGNWALLKIIGAKGK